MTPRPDVSEERKNQILEAAQIVFARSGFHKTRVDDIAKQANLSKGAVYWYFKSKDEIILALLERLFQWELQTLEAMLEAEGTVQERFQQFSDLLIAGIEEMRDFLPITYEFYALSSRQEDVQQFLQSYFTQFRDVVAAMLKQGIERQEIADQDPTELAVLLTALTEGLTVLWLIHPGMVNLQQMGKLSLKLLLQSLERPSS